MARRSSRSSGGRRTASPRPRAPPRAPSRPPARSASTASRRPAPPPARASPKQPTPQKNAAAPPPATQQPQQGSAMGGFMANVASTGLGVMAGRAMDRAFFGGGGGGAAPAEVPEGTPVSYQEEDYGNTEGRIEDSVCAREMMEFKKCMENNGHSVTACQWNIDILAACQQQQQSLGFADAGRL